MKRIYEMPTITSKTTQHQALIWPAENTQERGSRVLREFARYEDKLQEWAGRCSINAIWYLCDPFDAMRNANLGIDEELISELKTLHAEYNRRRNTEQSRRTA